MKELKLLAEDWKGEIDVRKADVVISALGTFIKTNPASPNWINAVGDESCFAMDGEFIRAYCLSTFTAKLEELTPEPRPADSIKLSEIDHCHIIIAKYHGDTCRIHAKLDTSGKRFYYAEVLHSSKIETKSTADGIFSTFSDIKIFDMTQ
jgi:hypothetical protein